MFVGVTKFVKEMMGGEISGKVDDFKAVPGCGLSCKVSEVQSMVTQIEASSSLTNLLNIIASSKK